MTSGVVKIDKSIETEVRISLRQYSTAKQTLDKNEEIVRKGGEPAPKWMIDYLSDVIRIAQKNGREDLAMGLSKRAMGSARNNQWYSWLWNDDFGNG